MAKKEKKGGTRLSTLIICFATVAASASGLGAAFSFPWFWQDRVPGFGAFYSQERIFYLLHWNDRLQQRKSIKSYQDDTCQAAAEYQAIQFGPLSLIIEGVQLGASRLFSSTSCGESEETEEFEPTEKSANEKKESSKKKSSSVACFAKNIATAPKGIFGCGYWKLCVNATEQRCVMYRVLNFLLTGTAGCICFGAVMGFLSLIFLFAENLAGKRKKTLTAARMKTFTCSLLGMMSIYIGALLAGLGWMFLLNHYRKTQQFPVPTPLTGVFAAVVSILCSTCACSCALDRFYPNAWEAICPCCSKRGVQVGDEAHGEFFEEEEEDGIPDDSAWGYSAMGMFGGMGPPQGMRGGGQTLL